jgi:UDP-N-acetylmuramoyl-L-alanyl-D-glutamate--2,6-diaminopimelate ligase
MKKLKTLLAGVSGYEVFGSSEVSVSEITDDSRKVGKASLFVAIPGARVDAHKFIPDVIAAGAVAVVGEKKPHKSWLAKATYVKVPDSRCALSLLASAWYGEPSKNLKIIGVTGTDGKTTTAVLIYWILNIAVDKVGLVSSISAKIRERELDTGFHVTNPEPLALQKFLAKMVKEGCKYAVLEVTSHGLDQERVAGIDFNIGVLTNITHEHLDYHMTWLDYFNAKAKLFKEVKAAVLNKDDAVVYEDIKCVVPSNAEVVSYGIKEESADYYGENIKMTKDGTELDVIFENKSYPIKTKLLGDYNVSNILAACAVARAFNIPWKKIQTAVSLFKTPIGRLQEIKNNKGFKIYIDFAHTPSALNAVLNLLKTKKQGKLIAVFGSAGERDIGKREQMGEISGRLADVSVFTAEDPRGEDVGDIINEMVKGAQKSGAKEFFAKNTSEVAAPVKRGKDVRRSTWTPEKGRGPLGTLRPRTVVQGNNRFIRLPERGEAISYAIQKLARKGDIVVVCGKGHEKSMAYNEVEYPWSDHEAVKIALKGGVKRIMRK